MTGEPIPLHCNEDLAAAFAYRGKDGPALDVDAPVHRHLPPHMRSMSRRSVSHHAARSGLVAYLGDGIDSHSGYRQWNTLPLAI